LPAGTIVNVRTSQAVHADASQVGRTIRGVVEDSVVVGNRVLVPRGSGARLEVVAARRAGNMRGRNLVTLELRSLDVRGRTVPVATSYVEFRGRREGTNTAGRVIGGGAIGGAVGGLLGGGTGAAVGATAGAATGALVAGSGRERLRVPAETLLQFRLNAPAHVRR